MVRPFILWLSPSFTEYALDADELEWYVPAGISPIDLRRTLKVIDQFLETPFDLQGKKASQFLGKKARRRRRKRSPSPESDDEDVVSGIKNKEKKKKKEKEKEVYKSAQFIEDSDEEYGDIEAFLEKEKEMRLKAKAVADAAGEGRTGNMKATGTKKRRTKGVDTRVGKKRKGAPSRSIDDDVNGSNHPSSGDSDGEGDVETIGSPKASPPLEQPKDRPRPRPVRKKTASTPSPLADGNATEPEAMVDDDDPFVTSPIPSTARRKGRIVISDDES